MGNILGGRIKGIEIGKVHGTDEIAVHPLIAVVMLETTGRLSFEIEAFEKILMEMKTLILKPRKR